MYKSKIAATEKWNLYEDLPKKNQNLFWSDDMNSRVHKTALRFNLNEEEKNDLLEIIGDLLLGLILPTQLKKILQENFSENITENLFNEIVRFIIYPINHLLREVYADEEFEKLGVKKSFTENEEKKWKTSFGDGYREAIED